MRSYNRKTLTALAGAFTIALSATLAAQDATTVFSDDFSAPTRTGWYVSATSSTALYTQNVGVGFTGPGETSNRHMITYFDAATVAVGEKLTLDFTFTVSADTTATTGSLHQFRFGLFNSSGGGKATADYHGAAGNASATGATGWTGGFNDYVGYSGTTNFSNSTSQLGLRERGGSGTAGQGLLTTGTGYTGYNAANNNLLTNANTADTKMVLAAGETYSISFSLSRVSETQMDLLFNISGTDASGEAFSYYISGTDSSGIVSTFDTFSFSVNNSLINFLVTGVEITKGAIPVPEPATVATLAGLAILLAAGVIRFRRR